jgi:hypothetical protein
MKKTPGNNQVSAGQVRDSNGRFGVSAPLVAPRRVGRPSREVERRYLKSLRDTVTPEEWTLIALKAKEQAIGGDRYARKWLSDYLMGPAPTTPIPEAQPAIIDQRSVNFDLSTLSGDQLKAAIELTKLINASAGTDKEGS